MASYLLARRPPINAVPRGGDDLDFDTHALGDLGADSRVEANDFILFVDEIERRIGTTHGDAHRALFGDGVQFIGTRHIGEAESGQSRETCRDDRPEQSSVRHHVLILVCTPC